MNDHTQIAPTLTAMSESGILDARPYLWMGGELGLRRLLGACSTLIEDYLVRSRYRVTETLLSRAPDEHFDIIVKVAPGSAARAQEGGQP